MVDYDYIVAFIAKLSERFKIREIAYDRYGAEKIRRDLEELGAENGFTVFPEGKDNNNRKTAILQDFMPIT